MRHLLRPASALACLLFVGCVYYNTFYNAKKDFASAVKEEDVEPGKANRDLLEKCVTRCEKVVKYHPRSKWADDAVLLMGKCFYYMGEYSNALRKFEELEMYYAEGGLLPEAYYYSGLANQAIGNREEAIASLKQAMLIDSRARFGERAAYEIVKTYYLDGDYEDALSSSSDFLSAYSHSRHEHEVLLLECKSLFEVGRYDEAVVGFDNLLASRPRKDIRVQALIKMGEAYLEMWETEEALNVLLSLRKESLEPADDANIAIKIAQAKRSLLRTDDAIRQLEEVAALYPRTQHSAEALYRIGEMYENDIQNLEKAREYYDKARTEAPYSEFSNEALLRATSIGKLTEYKEKVESGEESELAEAQFLLAELYYLEFNSVDEALVEYRKVVEEYSHSKYGPKAAFAIAWILDHVKDDDDGATEAYQEVAKKYPGTPYSEAASEAVRRMMEESGER